MNGCTVLVSVREDEKAVKIKAPASTSGDEVIVSSLLR